MTTNRSGRLSAQLLAALLIFFGLFGKLPLALQAMGSSMSQTDPVIGNCQAELPAVRWLGQGPADFTLTDDNEVFIVKRLPFAFFIEPGVFNSAGQRVYHAANKERVWACAGDCNLPAVYHAAYEIGNLEAGWAISLLVIDDDNDDRLNYWAENDPNDPYLFVQEQQMVEYLRLVIPRQATWFYYAVDSIGVVAMCLEETTPTATPTDTATPTSTPTPTATATFTPVDTPTPTETATFTPVDTPTPTETATFTPVDTPTPTETATFTPVDTPTPTETATPLLVDTATPTATATLEPPTALDPMDEPPAQQSWTLYLPLLAYE